MNPPCFSVIVPCYNVELYVGETMNSILGQTFKDWEAIIVNDGSTDGTEKIITEFAKRDPRIHYFSKPNEGVSPTWNFALKKACGKFIALLGADDVWMSDYLELQAQYLQKLDDNHVFLYTNAYIIKENKKTKTKYYPHIIDYHPSTIKIISLKDLITRNRIFGMVVFPRSMFHEIGGFDPNLRVGEDYDFWLRALNKGYKPVFNPMVRAYYRIRQDSLSNDREKVLESHFIIYNKILNSFRLSPVERRATIMAICRNRRERLIDLIKCKIESGQAIQNELIELCNLNCDKKILFIRALMKLKRIWAEKLIRLYFSLKS